MRLCNEFQSAYKTVTDPDSIQHLLDAGWREVVEQPIVKKEVEQKTETPKIRYKRCNALTYKGRSLVQWAQSGTIEELRSILSYLGVPFDAGSVKKTLQALLRQHIKQAKAAIKEESALDGK